MPRDKEKETKKSSGNGHKSSSKDKPSSSSKDKSRKSSSKAREAVAADEPAAVADVPSAEAGPEQSPPIPERPSAPAQRHDPPAAAGDAAEDPSTDFEAGLLFERYAQHHGGAAIDAHEFQRLFKEHSYRRRRSYENTSSNQQHQQHPWAQQQRGGDRFEIGQLFERFDSDKDGRLTRAEFEKLMNLRVQQQRQQAPDPDQYSAATAPTRLPGSPSPPRPPHHQRQRHMAADAPNMRWSQPAPAASAAAPSYGYPILPGALPLTHYNETAGVPLRKDAVEEQVALGHTVVPLHEAYSRRLARLQALVTSKLLPAREQLLQLRRRLLARGEEVQSAKAAIERETMADAHTILERLRSAEALKMATLEQRMSDVATELEQLDRLAQQVAGAAGTQEQGGGMAGAERYTHEFESTAKMIELVQSYGDLCASVERAASRLQDTSIAVTPNDFPQETAERLEVLRRADRYEKALAIKDQMIWNLMQEASHVVEKATAEAVLSKEYANEMAEWVDLTNRLTAQISELRLENARVPALEQENAKLEEQNRMLRARLAATGVGPDRNQ